MFNNIEKIDPDKFPKLETAHKIIKKLRLLCPDVFLAGGAPSDWYRGVEANDLDFYICLPKNMYDSGERIDNYVKEVVVKVLGVDLTKKESLDVFDPDYACMNGVKSVFEGEFDGVDFDLVFMSNNVDFDAESIVEMFDANITKMFMTSYGFPFIEVLDSAAKAVEHKLILVEDGVRTLPRSEKRLKKIMEKYPEYIIIVEGDIKNNPNKGKY